MKKKNLLAMLMVMVVGFTVLAGCGSKQTGNSKSATNNKKVTVVLMALNSDYWHMVEAGAKLAGKEFGYDVSVIGPNSESDSVGEINMIEDAITNKTPALVIAPNEPKAVIPSLEKAKSAKIPVIIIDANIASSDKTLRRSFIGTGNYAAGKTAGEYLASKLKPGDKVAIIRGLVGQPTHDDRTNGAKDALTAAGMNIVSIQPADSDRGKAVAVAENILQTNPDIKCFYSTNDEMALGVYQAIEGSQKQKQIITMGFDGSFGAMDSIAQGKLTASLAQMPIEEGYLGVKAAIDTLEGKTVEDTVSNKVEVLDSTNVKTFRADIDKKMAESKQ